jgi:hypothetical protein
VQGYPFCLLLIIGTHIFYMIILLYSCVLFINLPSIYVVFSLIVSSFLSCFDLIQNKREIRKLFIQFSKFHSEKALLSLDHLFRGACQLKINEKGTLLS